jgi:hypothetical protein
MKEVVPVAEVSQATLNWVKHRMIAYAKSRGQRQGASPVQG